MKRTFYLFSSGRLERKDNTLKFTPIKDDEGGEQELLIRGFQGVRHRGCMRMCPEDGWIRQ